MEITPGAPILVATDLQPSEHLTITLQHPQANCQEAWQKTLHHTFAPLKAGNARLEADKKLQL
jgi:hypothetical protein